MKNKMIKNILACVVFCALVLALVARVNDIVVTKGTNRYYILEKAIAEIEEHIEVQVFGACHSYTSFQAAYFEEIYGHTAYAMGNPGELIPATYLRMLERFREDTPEVALVEIWGINAYETYSSVERVFEYYMPVNVERLPLSFEKIEVIQDFYSLDLLQDNFAIAKYKDRIMNEELSQVDFEYTLEGITDSTSLYTWVEMHRRLENKGFCEMPFYVENDDYDPYLDVTDYHQCQSVVGDNEKLELEADMLKYVDKIIELCEEYDVELIFYRAPYISTENELRKANWLAEYCEQNDVLFLNLEKEIAFDCTYDLMDYYHLNETGAKKATDFLADYILEVVD